MLITNSLPPSLDLPPPVRGGGWMPTAALEGRRNGQETTTSTRTRHRFNEIHYPIHSLTHLFLPRKIHVDHVCLVLKTKRSRVRFHLLLVQDILSMVCIICPTIYIQEERQFIPRLTDGINSSLSHLSLLSNRLAGLCFLPVCT